MERKKITKYINSPEGKSFLLGEILLNDGVNLLVRYTDGNDRSYLILHTDNETRKIGEYNFSNLKKGMNEYHTQSKKVISKYKELTKQGDNKEMKKLTVVKTEYGVSNIKCLQFNYHDGGSLPTYDIGMGVVDITALETIKSAIEHGFEVEFENF